MSDGDIAAGLLSDLQKLDEAGCDRILNLLSSKDLKDIIKAFLHKRDTSSSNVAPQDQPYGHAHLGITRQTDFEHTHEATQRQDGKPAKRAIREPIARRCKQPRVEGGPQCRMTTGRNIVEIDTDEENKKSKGLDEDDPPKILLKESSLQESSIDSNNAIGPTQPREMQPKAFPMFLFLGDRYTTTRRSSIDCLPVHVRTELVRRFDNMWSVNEHTIAQYTEYTQNPENYKSRFQCIHTMMAQGSSADDPVRQVAKEPELSAGSKCTAAGYPCARLRWHKDYQGFFICFMPLPMGLRKGKSWDELGYWVLPETDATGVTTAR